MKIVRNIISLFIIFLVSGIGAFVWTVLTYDTLRAPDEPTVYSFTDFFIDHSGPIPNPLKAGEREFLNIIHTDKKNGKRFFSIRLLDDSTLKIEGDLPPSEAFKLIACREPKNGCYIKSNGGDWRVVLP